MDAHATDRARAARHGRGRRRGVDLAPQRGAGGDLLRRRAVARDQDGGHRHRSAGRAVLAGIPGIPEAAAGRVQRHPAVLDAGHLRAREQRRPHHALPGPRADGHACLRPDRLPQDRSVQQRGRPEVLPARLVRQRHPPVRRGLDLRSDRIDRVHRDRDRVRGRAHERRGARRARLPDRRRHVQGRRGALPLLDPGRVPGPRRRSPASCQSAPSSAPLPCSFACSPRRSGRSVRTGWTCS